MSPTRRLTFAAALLAPSLLACADRRAGDDSVAEIPTTIDESPNPTAATLHFESALERSRTSPFAGFASTQK